MTVDGQIKDEKLQYNINRKAAKISALSSGKISQYEYLTDEEILPSTQKQIIEQSKFVNSPLGKAFEKQTKTIKDQGQKQADALKDLKGDKQKQIKAIKDKSNDKLLIQEKYFNKLLDERMDEIEKMSGEIDFNKLTYYCKSPNPAPIKFAGFRGPLNINEEIKNGNILIKKGRRKSREI